MGWRTRGLALYAIDPAQRPEIEQNLSRSFTLFESAGLVIEASETVREWAQMCRAWGDADAAARYEAQARLLYDPASE
jgi:hypothetical protein